MSGTRERIGIACAVLLLVVVGGLTAEARLRAQVASTGPAAGVVPVRALDAMKQRASVALQLPDGRMLLLDRARVALKGEQDKQYVQSYTLPEPRVGAAAVVVPDGRVLIWGGVDDVGNILTHGQWFDPITGNFSPATSTGLSPVAGQTMTVLSNGKVLIAGGWDANAPGGEPLSLWNPVTGVAEALPAGRDPHFSQVATLQSDGTVLLTGGTGNLGEAASGSQRFDPLTGQLTDVQASTQDAGTLALAATQPIDGSETNPADSVIGVRFSETVRPESVTATTVSLIGPAGPVDVGVAGVQNGRLAFVTPKGDLLTGTRYTVVVSGVRSISGQVIPLTSFGFQTATLQSAKSGQPTSTGGRASTSAQTAGASLAGNSDDASAVGQVSSQATPITTLYRSTGVDAQGKVAAPATCPVSRTELRLCRNVGYIDQGAWYPGQDSAGTPAAGRWRINTPDMQPGEIAATVLARHAAFKMRAHAAANAAGALSGQIRLLDGLPAAHVQVTVGGTSAYTDAGGNFVLGGIHTGRQSLYVDGTTASDKDHEYGQFIVGVDVLPSGATKLPYRMYLPRILGRDKIQLPSPTTQDMVVTHPEMPGLEVHIPAGTVIRDHNGKVVTNIAIVPTPVDRAPYPVPVNFPVYFSMQPGGATIQNIHADASPGITLTYPNYGHVPSGTPAQFIAYEPDDGWRAYGKGAITPDGTQLKPESGVHLTALTSASWSMGDDHPDDPDSPKPDGPCCGDPVDLYSGSLVENQTDVTIKDILPIKLTRAWHGTGTFALVSTNYVQDSRMFGGWRSSYDMYVYSATGGWNDPALGVRLADGHLVSPFTATTTHPGSDATWRYAGTDPIFAGAVLDATLQSVCDNPSESECYTLTVRDGTQYLFDDLSGLYEVRDRSGNSVKLTRSAGYLLQITSPSGRYLSFAYNTDGTVSAVTDNTGRKWTYSYHTKTFQAGAWVNDSASPPSNPTGTASPMIFLDKVTYPDKTSTSFTYDEDLSPQTAGAGGGGTISSTSCPYAHLPGTLLTMIDRNGKTVMTNSYCNLALTKQTMADGSTYLFNYRRDSNNKTLETDVTDPLGHVTQTLFDSVSGYQSSVTQGYGTSSAETTTYVRDAGTGLVRSQTDALGRTTTYDYDASGNLQKATSLTGTSGAVSRTYTYTADNQVKTYTDEVGHTTTYTYLDGCLASVTDALAHVTKTSCNGQGQPVMVTNALGHSATMTYQGYDLRTVTDALGHTTTLSVDGLGRVVAVADPLGHTSQKIYDTNDRIISEIDASGQLTKLSYDNEGHLNQVASPNSAAIVYGFNSRYWVNERTDALGQSESWTYDGVGHVASYTDRKGQATTYGKRDVLGRFTSVHFADGNAVTANTYDAGNRLLKFTDTVSGTISRAFDGLDRLTSESTPQGAVAYSYYNNGLRKTMMPGTQAVITYTYDNGNRPATLVQGSEHVTYTYDDANRRATLTLPNGVVTTYGYDAADHMQSITYQSAEGAANLAYTYDAAGQRATQSGSLASDLLPQATAQLGAFDSNNRQSGFNGLTLGYDADGNLTSDGTNTYVWDARNRLTQVMQAGSVVASFIYDATGRRIGKTVGGTKTVYLYDGTNPVQETQGGTVNPILTGLGADERYARNEGGARAYFLTDALGSTIALTDASGALAQKYQYDPYGNVSAAASTSNRYLFTGRELDETGLYYYRARYYSPIIGRFISEDPIGFDGKQLNFYAYVGDNPTNYTDPTGNDPIIGATIGAIAGAIQGGLGAELQGGSWEDILTAGAIGGVLGAGIGALDPSLGIATLAVIGGVAGGLGDVVGQAIAIGDDACKSINWGSTVGATVGGAITGAGGLALGELGQAAGLSEALSTGLGASISSGPAIILPGVGAAIAAPPGGAP